MKTGPVCAVVFLSLFACKGEEEEEGPPATPPINSMPAVSPLTPSVRAVEAPLLYTISGLDDRQAYRITLVHGDNITAAGDGTATFVDANADGAADAGPSEEVGLITDINGGGYVPGFKTVPGTNDNPAAPSGLYPMNGQFIVTVEAIGGGTLYPVVYHNGGASTFLEIDAAGVPVETYAVGGSLEVEAPPEGPYIEPEQPQTTTVDDYVDYTISGLDDTYAYRVTLVHSDNITVGAQQTGTFIDADVDGAADAGPSEEVALITQVNGIETVPGAKTVPEGTDDPAAPTGVYPTTGVISVRLSGVGEGTVYPVAYRNGGESTFLELDPITFMPIEEYAVGSSLSVTPAVDEEEDSGL